MANIKSAIKRIDVNERKRQENLTKKSVMRSEIKRVENLVSENKADETKDALRSAYKSIDKAVQKGIVARNAGNRQKARLSKKVNAL